MTLECTKVHAALPGFGSCAGIIRTAILRCQPKNHGDLTGINRMDRIKSMPFILCILFIHVDIAVVVGVVVPGHAGQCAWHPRRRSARNGE
jgi:hypothetical protein